MRLRSILAAVATAALLAPVPTLAGGGDQPGDQTGQAAYQPRLMNVDQLIGQPVESRTGQDLGKLHELVMDPRRNGVAYAVVAHGGFMNFGAHHFAVPWTGLQIVPGDVPEHTKIVIDATRSRLQRAQRYDDDWPYTGDPRFIEAVHAAFDSEHTPAGEQPEWRQELDDIQGQVDTADHRGRRLGELAATDVSCASMDRLGEVEHLLVDVNHGHLAYVIVDVKDEAAKDSALGAEMVAVPWHAVQVRGTAIHVDATPQTLQNLAYQPQERWRLEDRDRALQMHREMQLEPYWVVSVWVPERYQVPADRMDPATMSSGEIMTVVGEITDIARGGQTVTLHVATDAGKTYVVDAGPPADLEAITVAPGDHVAVRGNRPEDGQEPKVDLVAHVISKDDQSVHVAARRASGSAQRYGN